MTQVLYAARKTATSDLYTVDPVTAALTSVGAIGSGMSGLAVDPTTGDLYGSTSGASADTESLYIIDTSTGAGTLIGSSGGFGVQMHDIAFDATGQMWGIDTCGLLYTIDKATGVNTLIGASGCTTYSGGFDFDSMGVAWRVGNRTPAAVAQTSTINLSTGVVTHVANTSDGNFLHSGKFDGSGVFWASSPGQTSGATELVTIDQTTGVVTPVAAFSPALSGIGPIAWGGTATPVLAAHFTGTPLVGFAPLSVAFTDASTPGPSGPITAWTWDFGDGHGSSVQNPSHTYTTPGSYSVQLTVTGTSPDGTASLTRTHYVHVVPPSVFYATLKAATSDLYTVDPATAVMTSIGPIGSGMSGIAFDPTTGDLYGSTSGASADSESLYAIDISTGAGTLIGSSGGFGVQVHDIAFDVSGQLWGVDTNGLLVKIDKATGALTYVGSPPTGTYSGGFDMDSGGTGWRVGNRNPAASGTPSVGTIDLTTGVVTHVSNTSDGHFLHAGKFDAADTFWAGSPGQTSLGATELVHVDPASGVVTPVAAFSVAGVGGLALLTTSTTPDFTASLVPSSINVSPGVNTSVVLNTTALHGDTETITLSATAPGGFTVTFGTNPITAGGDSVVNIAVGSPAPGTYSIVIHCDGTDNSHDKTLTVHVFASGTVPGFHLAS